MKERERLIAQLREQGLKLTPQRLAIIKLLEERGHYRVEDIYNKLKPQYPMLSRATVYNTLEVLKELGEVTELKIKPQVLLYDPETSLHYHFLCRRCGRLVDVEPLPEYELEKLSANLSSEELKGYKIDGVQVYLYGICATCLESEKEKDCGSG